MKKLINNLLLLVVLSFVYSACQDEKLDPLQTNAIKKGTLLALRGSQYANLAAGSPGAELFPKIATGTEKFVFDAEFLASDPNSLESVDIFVLKKTSFTAVPTRVLLRNVSASAFSVSKYPRPSTTISFTLTEILTALGLPVIFPLDPAGPTVATLLSTYKTGVAIESDLNLKDGSKAPASNVVAAGLFQSNQFYPAQKLSWAMTDYCTYDVNSWTGNWIGTEVFPTFSGDDNITITKDATTANKFIISGFWGLVPCGGPNLTAFVIFNPSTNPSTQTLTMPSQSDGLGGTISGTKGVYNQCLNTFSVQVTYVQVADFASCGTPPGTYVWRYDFSRP
jgi:hypothetical protein